VNVLGQSSRFKYVGSNLHLVASGRKGKIVDGVKTSLAIRAALTAGKSTAAIHLKEHRPGLFSAEDFKKLSFPDVLARGESNFAGSPKNRIHNIRVGTSKFDGLVLMAGEEFSFNQYLGNVDAANGYLPELVIKENVTTPEYGGGICQVSTTAFRAAMQSGMKITSRRNHSYPVAYYGTPGYDATVYQPAPDFKFVNDTGNPVHLTTQIVGTRVIFEVKGKKAGREVRVNGPFVTKRNPDGSLTAAVAQFVKQNGKTIREQNFVSHYQPADKFPEVRSANGE
jgi:vancomycin resistance protein YoaR